MKYRFITEDNMSIDSKDYDKAFVMLSVGSVKTEQQGYKKVEDESSDNYVVYECKYKGGSVARRVLRIEEI